jgi:hypothetical protein
MNKTPASEPHEQANEELLPEYNFDDRSSRFNRFANQNRKAPLTITINPDVAEVFTISVAVNHALRALLSAMPKTER